MQTAWDIEGLVIFGLALVATFVAAWKGRRDARDEAEAHISRQRLNRWLVGLSAGAAANSGFVVTGAVGLGYAFGVYWLLLPFAWFLGDLVFWKFFPHRINEYGARANATTITDLITYDLRMGPLHPLKVTSSVIVVVCLGGYTMAQWVAGQKFLDGAFGLSGYWTLIFFAGLIITYSSIGGFRGSVYADTFQAVMCIIGTLIALGTVCWFVAVDFDAFAMNLRRAGDGFLNLLGGGTLASAMAVVFGYAAAALGFGLGQPQVTTRYIAARSPSEAHAARWIYIGYVQLTWATMTVFGVLLRGVMPNISDPEKGLMIFVSSTLPSLLVGLIAAQIFAEIASTANSLLVAMAQAARDLFGRERGRKVPLWLLSLVLGLATMLGAVVLDGRATVFGLAIASVSLMGAGLAPAVAVKVLGWRHSAWSITAAVYSGFIAALAWKAGGLSDILNESAIGITVGLLANFLLSPRRGHEQTQLSEGDSARLKGACDHGTHQDEVTSGSTP